MTSSLPGLDPAHDLRVVGLFVSPGHNFFGRFGQPADTNPTLTVDTVECVKGYGLRGDRFFGYRPDYKGQATFFAAEVWEALCAEFKVADRDVSVFRRNIITRGIDLNSLIGQEFTVQGIRFVGTGEARPCHWMDQAFAPGAEDALKGRGGLRARVLSDGVLRCDD